MAAERVTTTETITNGCAGDESWRTLVVVFPIEQISYVSSILEAYDNEFLVRTYDKAAGLVYIWYAAGSEATLEQVILEFRTEFAVTEVARHRGMAGLDEVYPE